MNAERFYGAALTLLLKVAKFVGKYSRGFVNMSFLRILLAVVLSPLAGVMIYRMLALFFTLGRNMTAGTLPFWAGIVTYGIFQAVFSYPVRTYVFGHELTHALAGLLSGARIKKFKVGAAGGSVSLTKVNLWIALSPYFIPVYTALALVAYWVGGKFWPLSNYHGVFLFVVGFTLAFHVCLTYYALKQGQSDLEEFGVFFSLVVIALVNCLFLVVLLKLLFPGQVNVHGYLIMSMRQALDLWSLAYRVASRCYLSI